VVISTPQNHGYYGGDVAGPVFREIADHCFIGATDVHEALNVSKPEPLQPRQWPNNQSGLSNDLDFLIDALNLPAIGRPDTDWSVLRVRSDSLLWENRNTVENIVPNVTGMGLRDALYLIENQGLRASVSGFGKVTRQSIKPGTRARGQTVRLFLN